MLTPRTPRPGGYATRGGIKPTLKGRQVSRIKNRCEDLGISLTEAAHRADMAQAIFSRYANGNITPTIYTCLRIADALDTTVDYLWNMSRDYSSSAQEAA